MECLRLFPPVPMTIRKAATDGHVDGVFVPKGTLFYIPVRISAGAQIPLFINMNRSALLIRIPNSGAPMQRSTPLLCSTRSQLISRSQIQTRALAFFARVL